MKKLLPLVTLAAMPTLAADNTLTVYTYSSFASDWGPGPAIEKAFEAQCECNLEFVALDDGVSILNRIRLRARIPKPMCYSGLITTCSTKLRKLAC